MLKQYSIIFGATAEIAGLLVLAVCPVKWELIDLLVNFHHSGCYEPTANQPSYHFQKKKKIPNKLRRHGAQNVVLKFGSN